MVEGRKFDLKPLKFRQLCGKSKILFWILNLQPGLTNFFFRKSLVDFFFLSNYLLDHNFKIFFLNLRGFYLNTNLLNFSFNRSVFFNDCYFFFFFKQTWLKKQDSSVNLVSFLTQLNTKVVFFFKPTTNPQILSIFSSGGFLSSGLVVQNSHSKSYDFPIKVDSYSIINFYVFYTYFFKISFTKFKYRVEKYKNIFFYLSLFY